MEVHPKDEIEDPSEEPAEKSSETYFDLYNPTGKFKNYMFTRELS